MKLRSFVIALALALSIPATALAGNPPAPPAPAEPTPEAKAAELKARADEAMDQHHYDEAIAIYTEAFATFPDARLLYNRSRAHEARGEYPEAYDDLAKFADTAQPDVRAKVPRLTDLLIDLKGKVATLELNCAFAGARVLLNGKQIGSTPLPQTRVNAGHATLEILGDGQFPYKREFDLKGGGTNTVDAVLQPKANNALLSIKSVPVSALVTVDGKPFGRTPTEGIVSAGTHALVASAEGYSDAPTQAVVTAGASKEVSIELHKKTILKSPWFWTGVGVVVVGAVVGVVAALLIERPADPGSGFTPGQVAGPLRF